MSSIISKAHRETQDLDVLAEITRETLSSLDVDQLLLRNVRLLQGRFGYDAVLVGVLDGEYLEICAAAGGGIDGELQRRVPWKLPADHGSWSRVLRGSVPHCCSSCKEGCQQLGLKLAEPMQSCLCVPMSYRGHTVGLMAAMTRDDEPFDDADVELLQVSGALVAPVVDAARLVAQERRRVHQLRVVDELSCLLMSSFNRTQMVELGCHVIRQALGISFAGVALRHRQGQPRVAGGHAIAEGSETDGDFDAWSAGVIDGPIGRAIAAGRTVRVGRLEAVSGYQPMVRDSRSVLAVPVRATEDVVGVLVLEHCVADCFGDDDEAMAGSLAAYLGQAIENARLFDAQQRRWQELVLINDVVRMAAALSDVDEIAGCIAHETHHRFKCDRVGVLLREEDDLVVRAMVADRECNTVVGERWQGSDGLAFEVLATGRARIAAQSGMASRGGLLCACSASVMCVPLEASDRAIGVLQVESARSDAFSDEDMLVIETLAQSVAGPIASAASLRHTRQLREDLYRMVVHDLRNPLMVVRMTLTEIAQSGQIATERQEALVDGLRATDEMLEMVSSLLDVARLESGRVRPNLVASAINDHVSEVVRRFDTLARSREVEVKTRLQPQLPLILADYELLRRLLGNLLSNAIKHTPAGTTVVLTTQRIDAVDDAAPPRLPPPYVLLAVKDNGPGIPADFHQKIFDSFGQVESRKAGLEASTGLGLTVCRYVAQAHGGQIWVESEPGQGATFFVAFPVLEPR